MEINKYIDSTNLNAFASKSDIKKLCDDAIKYKFASVCVNPYYVGLAKKYLGDNPIDITCVVGFPLGMNKAMTKEYEAIAAVEDGASEIDMVINIGALKDKNYEYVKKEIESIRDAIDGNTLKVIIETCYVNFIKTSTGFGTRGASLEDISIINKYKNEILEIKASGGIKNFEDACSFIEAGVSRIGTSHAEEIMNVKEEK